LVDVSPVTPEACAARPDIACSPAKRVKSAQPVRILVADLMSATTLS